ncbi:Phage holin protein [compost metagenome]
MDAVYQNIIENLLSYVVTAVALIVIAFVLRYWRAFGSWLNVRKSAAEADEKNKLQALLWAKAVEAYAYAETAFVDLDGADKLNEALHYVSSKLAQLGISYSTEEMRAAIEKAWLEYEGIDKN